MITFDYDSSSEKGRLVCDEDVLDHIRNHFSEKVAGVDFANRKLKAMGSKRTLPDRAFAIQQSGRFDVGMYKEIENFIYEEQLDCKYSDKFTSRLQCGFSGFEIYDDLKYELRDYQLDSLESCLESGCGTVVLGTGGGKSLLQAALIENWIKLKGKIKCLIVVPGTSLVSQLLNDFEDYQVSFSFSGWTGSMERQDTDIIIVNTEYLTRQFENNRDLMYVDLVLRDECHGSKNGNKITKVISKIKTPNKFGFTGTLPKEQIDRWKIIGTFGPIIYEKSSKELRDEDYLAPVSIKILKLIHRRKVRGYKEELLFIHTDKSRCELIAKFVSKFTKNVLIIVNSLEHGQNLLNALQLPDKAPYFISGEMPVEDRLDIINEMETQNNVVCVAMGAIFSGGINIKNLHYVIFAGGGKSFVRTVQAIGRGLRLHPTKNKLVILDLCDNFKYALDHCVKRKEHYDEEQIEWSEAEIKL